MKFTGVCLITEDIGQLVGFYQTLFETAATGDQNHAELSACGTCMAFFTRAGMEGLAPGSMASAGTGSVTLGFEVEDIEDEFVRVCEIGAEIVKPPQTHPWGARSFWFRDPDGNIVSFYQMA